MADFSSGDIKIITDISKDILNVTDLDSLLQRAIDALIDRYGMVGGVLLLVEGNILQAKTVSQNAKGKEFQKYIRVPVNSLQIDLSGKHGNLIVKSIIEGTPIIDRDIRKFTKGAINPAVNFLLPMVTGAKNVMSLPLKVEEKVIGAVVFAKSNTEPFINEPLLLLTANILTIAIIYAQRYREVQGILKMERDMLDILAHELRTPLGIGRNAVQLMRSLLEKGALTTEKSKQYLDIAVENLQREVTLLETMLSATKVDNNRLSLVFEKVDMLDVVEDSLVAFTEKAEGKGLKLNKKLPEEAFAYLDRTRIQEIADNLVDNAIKYTDKGSVTVSIETDKESVSLIVKDTGRGIPKNEIGNLGQKFYRLDNYLPSSEDSDFKVVRPGGTGLGLYVAFSLIKSMKGTIVITSEVGKGTTCSVKFPKYKGQKTAAV